MVLLDPVLPNDRTFSDVCRREPEPFEWCAIDMICEININSLSEVLKLGIGMRLFALFGSVKVSLFRRHNTVGLRRYQSYEQLKETLAAHIDRSTKVLVVGCGRLQDHRAIFIN